MTEKLFIDKVETNWQKKSFEDLTISDDFMFCLIMQEKGCHTPRHIGK